MKLRTGLQTKSAFALILTVALLALSATTQAAGNARLQLSLQHTKVRVGQEVAVDVLVKDAPTLYGADVRLVFDPPDVGSGGRRQETTGGTN